MADREGDSRIRAGLCCRPIWISPYVCHGSWDTDNISVDVDMGGAVQFSLEVGQNEYASVCKSAKEKKGLMYQVIIESAVMAVKKKQEGKTDLLFRSKTVIASIELQAPVVMNHSFESKYNAQGVIPSSYSGGSFMQSGGYRSQATGAGMGYVPFGVGLKEDHGRVVPVNGNGGGAASSRAGASVPPYCSTGVRYPFVASNPFVPQKAVQSQKGINVTMAASPSKPVTRNLVTAVPIIPPRRTPSFNKINFSSSTAIAWDRQRQVSVSAPKPTVSRQSFLSTQSGTNAVRVSDERLLVGSFSGQIDRSRQMNLCMTPPRRQMSAVQLNMEYRRPMCTDMQMGMEYVRIGMGRSMQVGAPSPKSPFQVDIGRNDSTSSLKNKDDGVPIKDAVKVPYSKNVGQTVTVEGSVQNKSSCVETNTGQDSTSYVHNEDINRSMSSDAVKDVDCKRLVTASTSTDGSLSVNEDFGNNFCGHCGTSRKSKCEGSGDTLNNANMSTGVKRRLDDKEIQDPGELGIALKKAREWIDHCSNLMSGMSVRMMTPTEEVVLNEAEEAVLNEAEEVHLNEAEEADKHNDSLAETVAFEDSDSNEGYVSASCEEVAPGEPKSTSSKTPEEAPDAVNESDAADKNSEIACDRMSSSGRSMQSSKQCPKENSSSGKEDSIQNTNEDSTQSTKEQDTFKRPDGIVKSACGEKNFNKLLKASANVSANKQVEQEDAHSLGRGQRKKTPRQPNSPTENKTAGRGAGRGRSTSNVGARKRQSTAKTTKSATDSDNCETTGKVPKKKSNTTNGNKTCKSGSTVNSKTKSSVPTTESNSAVVSTVPAEGSNLVSVSGVPEPVDLMAKAVEFQQLVNSGYLYIVNDGVGNSVSTGPNEGEFTDKSSNKFPVQLDGQGDSSIGTYASSEPNSASLNGTSSFDLSNEEEEYEDEGDDDDWEDDDSAGEDIITSTPIGSSLKRRIAAVDGQSPEAKRMKNQNKGLSTDQRIRKFLVSDEDYGNDGILAGLGMEDDKDSGVGGPMWSQFDPHDKSQDSVQFEVGSDDETSEAVTADDKPELTSEERSKLLGELLSNDCLSEIRWDNLKRSAAIHKKTPNNSCFRYLMSKDDIVHVALALSEAKGDLNRFRKQMMKNPSQDCIIVQLDPRAKVIHHQYRRTIFGYLGDYYDRNDIDLDVIHENRLTSMTNLFVNSAVSYISTDIMGINTANGNLTPRISKRLDKWFDYEEITFLRVFYTLIMIDNIPKDEVTFWHCMTVTMKEYGVFKDTKALKDYETKLFKVIVNKYDQPNEALSQFDRMARLVIAETKVLRVPALGGSLFGIRSALPEVPVGSAGPKVAQSNKMSTSPAVTVVRPRGSPHYISLVNRSASGTANAVASTSAGGNGQARGREGVNSPNGNEELDLTNPYKPLEDYMTNKVPVREQVLEMMKVSSAKISESTTKVDSAVDKLNEALDQWSKTDANTAGT